MKTTLSVIFTLMVIIGVPVQAMDNYVVRSPVSGGTWGNRSPGNHTTYVTSYSVDIYASSGSNVRAYLNTASPFTPAAYLHIIDIGNLNCGASAGKFVTIGVYTQAGGTGTRIGTLHYAHLKDVPTSLSEFQDIASGTLLGKTHQWAYSSCYQVIDASDVHVHFEIGGGAGRQGLIAGYRGTDKPVPANVGLISDCGTHCSACVTGARQDILPAFMSWGWSGACQYRDSIIREWCNIDPNGCLGVMTNSCNQTCNGTCGNDCTHCVLSHRQDILPAFKSWGWNTSCNNRDAVVNEWCNIDPSGCNAVKTNYCSYQC